MINFSDEIKIYHMNVQPLDATPSTTLGRICAQLKWRNKLLIAFAIIIILLLVMAVSLAIQPKPVKANLRMKQKWDPVTPDSEITHFIHNRTGDILAWLSPSGWFNFATIQNDSIIWQPDWAFQNPSAANIHSFCIDDTCKLFAVADSKQVFVHRFQNQKWNLESTYPYATTAIHYDENSQLLLSNSVSLKKITNGHTINMPSAIQIQAAQGIIITLDQQGVIHVIENFQIKQELDLNGNHFTLDPSGRKLFVSCESKESVEYYRYHRGEFVHVQTIYNSVTTLAKSLFGFCLSANEQYLAIASPSGPDDHFSLIQVYHFDAEDRVNLTPQQISVDVSYLGRSLWLCPMGTKLTLIASNEHGAPLGQLVMLQ